MAYPGDIRDPLDGILLAITTTDDLVHVGTVEGLRRHLDDHAQQDRDNEPPRVPNWEIFEVDGHRWRIVQATEDGDPTGFEPIPDAPEPTDTGNAYLVDRLDAFQARVQVVLDGLWADDAREHPPFHRSPRVTGELRQVAAALYKLCPADPGVEEPHPGSPLHNLWHLVFG